MSTAYDSDLTAEQWELLAPLFQQQESGGRPCTTDMPSVLNTIFYLVVTGCQWRQLSRSTQRNTVEPKINRAIAATAEIPRP